MSPATKLTLRRFALRWLRKLVDVADEELHIAEAKLREEIAGSSMRTIEGTDQGLVAPTVPANPYAQWEARRSGIAPKVKHHRARRRVSAADFDFQIIRKREEFLQ